MRDNEKEDARKRGGGGRINEGGAHSRYQFFRCGKIGGGRINDGGRSGGTLRYIYRMRKTFRRLVDLYSPKCNSHCLQSAEENPLLRQIPVHAHACASHRESPSYI